MVYLKIALSSLISAAVLFFLTKLIGYRQISEMSAFDYVNSITIGSIAAEMSFATGKEFFFTLDAMLVFGLITFFLSILTDKSIIIRRLVEGTPIILFENGKLYSSSLKKAHIDINEFLVGCRNSGYFDLSKLYCVILETNGKMSFIPKEEFRPSVPLDFYISPTQEKLPYTVIDDGKIIKDNLKKLGFDEKYLFKKAAENNIDNIKNVFFASLDCDGNFIFFNGK